MNPVDNGRIINFVDISMIVTIGQSMLGATGLSRYDLDWEQVPQYEKENTDGTIPGGAKF
jgi:hypothetical protein